MVRQHNVNPIFKQDAEGGPRGQREPHFQTRGKRMALEDKLNPFSNKEGEGGPRGQTEPHFQTGGRGRP